MKIRFPSPRYVSNGTQSEAISKCDFLNPQVFTTLALLTMLVAPLNAFPWVINGLVEAWISLRRLEKFTRLPSDCRLNAMFQPTSANTTTDLWDSVADLNRPSVITMYDACFTWAPSNDGTRSAEEQLILEEDLSPVQDLTLEINRVRPGGTEVCNK